MARSFRFFSAGLLVLTFIGAGFACQGSDLTLPSDGPSFSLGIVSGDGQQGTVGSELDSALVVKVTDRSGQPAVDITLRFEPKTPGARVEPEVTTTNENGEAETRVVQLGDIEGTQTVEARLEVESALKTSFSLTAVAGEPPEDDDDEGGRGRGRGNGDGHGNDDDD
jgi:hypothetical protein